MALLNVRSLESFYGPIRVLHGVSFHADPGEIVALIGANGAGKSTILRTISGLVRARRGEILFEGKPIHQKLPHQIVEAGITHAPEGRKIFPRMTVQENLEMGAFTRRDRDGLEKDFHDVFQIFPRLRERLKQLGGTLSGGEQQMLAIARALMARPKLLLLDEPSLGLAPLLVKTIFQTIQQIKARGVTLLLVEQNAQVALSIADRAYVLETGRVILEGSAAEISNNPRVQEAYLGI